MFLGRPLYSGSLLLLLCLSGCVGGQGATASDLSARDWALTATDHFRVYSDLEASQIEALAVELERDVDLIAQAAFGKVKTAVEATDVILFSKKAHYHRYFNESTIGVAYRLPLLPEGNHTVATVRTFTASMRATLRHELVHDLFARNFGAAPPWLSEGFAEYFSTVQLVDGKIYVGKAPPDRVLTKDSQPFTFREDGLTVLAVPFRMVPPPSALVRMSAQEFYVQQRDSFEPEKAALRTAVNYFAAWAFVHFLMDAKGEYSSRYNRFLREVRTTSVTHAWEEAFGDIKDERLDGDFRAYLWGGNLAVAAIPYQESRLVQAPQTRALGTGEKHVLLAKLALAANRPIAEKKPLFLEHVDAAIRSQQPPPESYYLRGVFAAALGSDTDAKRDFESAVQLAPSDPRFLRASLDHQLSMSAERDTLDVVEELRDEIVKLEQLSSAPLELLLVAKFLAAVGQTDRALVLGNQAARQAPVDPFVLSRYATVLEMCGNIEKAVDVQRLALEFVYEDPELQKRFSDTLKQLESRAKSEVQPPKLQ